MQLAIPVCQAAQRQCPRTGPGRPPKYDDWKLAVIIKLENLVQQHRQKRISFYLSPPGQQLYAQRSQTVEPFNDWFKSLFELWHYGLQNNQTQILAAIFCYQLLLRYNRRCGRKNGQIKWVLDTL